MKTSFSRIFFMLWFLLCLSAGCSQLEKTPAALISPTEMNFETTNTPSPIATEIITASPSPNSSPTTKPTATETVVFSPTPTPIETITPPPSPTRTPLPTVLPENLEEFSVELLTTNTGCKFPCWWGFTPGRTRWDEAEDLLALFDSNIYIPFTREEQKTFFFAGVVIPVPTKVGYGNWFINHTYYVSEGIIQAIDIDPGYIETNSLSSFLDTYGHPGEIWIETNSNEDPPGYLPFIMVLFYPEQGILAIRYAQAANITPTGTVRGCQFETPVVDYFFWDPSLALSLGELKREFEIHSFSYNALPLEEATSMDIPAFFEAFSQPNNSNCIETPQDLWPQQ